MCSLDHAILLSLLFTVIMAYNTMAPIWIPTPDIKTFTLTYFNNLGGTPHS